MKHARYSMMHTVKYAWHHNLVHMRTKLPIKPGDIFQEYSALGCFVCTQYYLRVLINLNTHSTCWTNTGTVLCHSALKESIARLFQHNPHACGHIHASAGSYLCIFSISSSYSFIWLDYWKKSPDSRNYTRRERCEAGDGQLNSDTVLSHSMK